MKRTVDNLTMRELHLLAAATDLAELLYRWNVIDELPLVVQDHRKGGTPYHHVDQALIATLKLLGTKNKEGFYECVTSGMTAFDSLERAKSFENPCGD